MKRSILLAVTLAMFAVDAGAQQTAMRRVRLDRPAVHDGVQCAPTGRAYAEFYPSGRLGECPLAADTVIAGHSFAAGTWIFLTETGALRSAWLPRNTMLDGHLCRGTGYKGWSVTFHPGDGLKSCFLAREEVISGVRCRRGTFWNEITGGVNVYFHGNGALQSCSAAADVVVQGVTYRKRDRVTLDAQGLPLPPDQRRP